MCILAPYSPSLSSLVQHHCRCAQVTYEEDGLAALLFVSEGDMRQALNSLQVRPRHRTGVLQWVRLLMFCCAQACHSGFGLISQENVFKVHTTLNTFSWLIKSLSILRHAQFVCGLTELCAGVRPASPPGGEEHARELH